VLQVCEENMEVLLTNGGCVKACYSGGGKSADSVDAVAQIRWHGGRDCLRRLRRGPSAIA